MKILSGLLIVVLVIFAMATISWGITITRDGQPTAVIVVADDAPRSVQLAAGELRDHVKLMSGATLEIVPEKEYKDGPAVVLGASRLAEKHGVDLKGIGIDGFHMAEPVENVLMIRGRDYAGDFLPGWMGKGPSIHQTPDKSVTRYGETGTLFGVYRLLRSLGVRWYSPGAKGTIAPAIKTITFTTKDTRITPPFSYRELSEGAFFFDLDPEAALWYKRCGFGAHHYIFLNHAFDNWPLRFPDRPEFFETRNGKSVLEIMGKDTFGLGHTSINLSEPKVFDQVMRDARQWYTRPMVKYWRTPPRNIPEESQRFDFFDFFSVMPNDGFSDVEQAEKKGLLTPERGSDGRMSDYVWGFANRVAREIRKEFPRAKIVNLAYGQYTLPPRGKLEPNIIVGYVTSTTGWPTGKARILKELDEWKSKKPAEMYIFDNIAIHNYNENLYGACLIMPRTIHDFWKSMKGRVNGVTLNVMTAPYKERKFIFENQPVEHLNLYMLGRCLWEPGLDVEKELDEYYRLYYGPAADSIRAVVEIVEKQWIDAAIRGDKRVKSLPPNAGEREKSQAGKIQSLSELFPPNVIHDIFLRLDKAKHQAVEEPYRTRVAEFFDSFRKMRARMQKLSEVPSLTLPRLDQLPKIDGQVADDVEKSLNNLETKQTADENGVMIVRRTGPTAMVDSSGGDALENPPTFYAARTDTHLYLAAKLPAENAQKLRAENTKHDSNVWEDDCVEIFLSAADASDSSMPEYYQIVVNSKGTVYDAKSSAPPADWSSNAQVATRLGEGYWLVEIAIPLDAVGKKPEDKRIRFDIMNTRYVDGREPMYLSWSPTFGSYHNISRHGFLILRP